MANIKSQKKRIKTNEKARIRNKAIRSELKTVIKHVDESVAAGDVEAAKKYASLAYKKLDHAAYKGVIHKNQANNRKSNLMKRVNSIQAAE